MRYLIGFFIIINAFCVKAQSDYDAIIRTFDSYRLLVENKEYYKAFDFYLDSFLLYVPKEQLMKQFSDMNNNENIEYSVSGSEISFVSEIIEDNRNKKYAFVKYSSYYHYKFKSSADEEYRQKIKNMYRNQHGNNYSFSEKEEKISFLKKGELIAIKQNAEWRFIIYQDKLKPYMNLWIPQEVFVKLLAKKEGENMINR